MYITINKNFGNSMRSWLKNVLSRVYMYTIDMTQSIQTMDINVYLQNHKYSPVHYFFGILVCHDAGLNSFYSHALTMR